VVHNSWDLATQVIRSDSLKRVMKLAQLVACHPAAVLIVGETGTGKEMMRAPSTAIRCAATTPG